MRMRYRVARPRIGLHHVTGSLSGPGRYVEALLDAIDPAEFDVVVFGRDDCEYSERTRRMVVHLDGVGRSEPNGSDANGRAGFGATGGGVQPKKGGGEACSECNSVLRRHTRTVFRRVMPASLRLSAGLGRDALRMASVFGRARLDLLHTQHIGLIEEASFAGWWATVPRVLGTFHVDSSYDLDLSRSCAPYRLLERIVSHSLDRAIAVSEATKGDWIRRCGLPARRVTTIHNGIDPARFRRGLGRPTARRLLGLPEDARLIIGGVGRLDTAKGYEYLVEAVALLAREFPSLILVLAGEGPLRSRLVAKARDLGIADRVRLLGFLNDVGVVYDALDVFALSSLCEALPFALLEAMAHELPVVGTSVGGVPEVIVPRETGFVVPPRDSVALAAALRPLLASMALRRRMGVAGRRHVEETFTERRMAQRTIGVYREMLDVPS